MDMFLAVFGLSLVAVVVSAVLFSAAVRPELDLSPAPDVPRPADGSRFFVRDMNRPRQVTTAPAVPVEVLLLQIERHVRLEQAAAESFHLCPTTESLHMQTTSPLVH